jgi:hypothetical protein
MPFLGIMHRLLLFISLLCAVDQANTERVLWTTVCNNAAATLLTRVATGDPEKLIAKFDILSDHIDPSAFDATMMRLLRRPTSLGQNLCNAANDTVLLDEIRLAVTALDILTTISMCAFSPPSHNLIAKPVV